MARVDASTFRANVEKDATAYLINMFGEEQGKKAAARVALAFAAAARATNKPDALYGCSRASVVAAVATSAFTDLMPGGPNPLVWLVPKGKELQWWISHRGIGVLARRAGYLVVPVPVHVDEECEIDFREVTHHRGTEWPDSLKTLAGVYVTIRRLSDGLVLARPFLHVDAIDKIRRKHGGPVWNQWPIEMAQKTAIKWVMARGILPLDDSQIQTALNAEPIEVAATSHERQAAPTSGHAALGLPDYGEQSDPLEGIEEAEAVLVEAQSEEQEAAL